MVTQYKFVENKDVTIYQLNEGYTTNGMKLALCSVLEEGLVTNITQFVHCKDYFNDVLFSEKFNKAVGPIHGFRHKPIGYFSSDKFYCIMKVTKTYYPNMKDIGTINKFMKEFSEAHHIPTINVYEVDSNGLLFEIPIEATKNLATFSLTTNMIRLCTIIDGQSYADFFNNIQKLPSHNYNNEVGTFKNLLSASAWNNKREEHLNYILFGGSCDYAHKENAVISSVHNAGWQTLLTMSEIKVNTSKYTINEINYYSSDSYLIANRLKESYSYNFMALCTLKDGVITNIGSFMTCKDYVQDLIHQEVTGYIWSKWIGGDKINNILKEQYYYIMLVYNSSKYDRIPSLEEMNSHMKTFSEIFRIPTITIDRVNDNSLLMKVPTVVTEDKALCNCIFSMFRLIFYTNGNYHETIEKYFIKDSLGVKAEKDSEISQFRYNELKWKDNYLKYLTQGGTSRPIKTEAKGSYTESHVQGWRTLVTQNKIKLFEMPVVIKEVAKKLRRVSVRSRHPSHAPLRGLLPRLPYRAVVRFGSTTEVDSDVEINSIQSIRNSADKLLMKQCFTKDGVKTTNWWYLNHHDKTNISKVIGIGEDNLPIYTGETISFPMVAKHRFGSRGEGNYLLNSQEEFDSWKKGKTLANYLYEPFVTHSREYRLHVTKNGCVYTCRKMLKTDTPDDKRWFRNDSNSVWILEENELFDKPSNWDNIVSESVKALNAVGLDICSVDVKVQSRVDKKGNVRTSPDFVILETNSASSMGTVTLEKYTELLPKLIQQKYDETRNIKQ